MKLSLRGEYALRALLVLGQQSRRAVVRIEVISRQQNIPKRFLEQILNDLKSIGVVESKRGVADRKSTRLNSRHIPLSRMPSSA